MALLLYQCVFFTVLRVNPLKKKQKFRIVTEWMFKTLSFNEAATTGSQEWYSGYGKII